jgi:hypothetical protein
MPTTIQNPKAFDLPPNAEVILQLMFAGYARVVIKEEFTSGLAGSRVFLVRPILAEKASTGQSDQGGGESRQPKGQGDQQAEAQRAQPGRRRDARGDGVSGTPAHPAFSREIPNTVRAFVAHRRWYRAAGANEVLVLAAAATQTRLDLGMAITVAFMSVTSCILTRVD